MTTYRTCDICGNPIEGKTYNYDDINICWDCEKGLNSGKTLEGLIAEKRTE